MTAIIDKSSLIEKQPSPQTEKAAQGGLIGGEAFRYKLKVDSQHNKINNSIADNQPKKRDTERVGKAPAFQLYVKDFISDGKVLAMPLHCRGSYITLLCIDWNDDGIDENDFVALSLLDQTDLKSIERVRKLFVPHPTKPGYVTNPRLIAEREGQAERRLKAQDAAGIRWHGKGRSKRSARALPKRCTASPTTSTSTSTTNNNKGALSSADFTFPDYLNTPRCKSALDDYIRHRAERKKPVTKTQIEKVLKKYATKADDFIRNIERSIENGWLGVFEPETKGKQLDGPSADPRINVILKSIKNPEAA